MGDNIITPKTTNTQTPPTTPIGLCIQFPSTPAKQVQLLQMLYELVQSESGINIIEMFKAAGVLYFSFTFYHLIIFLTIQNSKDQQKN